MFHAFSRLEEFFNRFPKCDEINVYANSCDGYGEFKLKRNEKLETLKINDGPRSLDEDWDKTSYIVNCLETSGTFLYAEITVIEEVWQ